MTPIDKDLATVDSAVDSQKLALQIGCKTPLAAEFVRYALAQALLFDRKQMDYGPGNIAKFGDYGVVVRTSDKIERLTHLYGEGQGVPRKAKNESVEDTFRDVTNYGIIALMYRAGKWAASVLPAKKRVRVKEDVALATTEQPNSVSDSSTGV